MNRRTAILASLAGASTLAILTPKTHGAEKAENPELEKVRALLKAHDDAMTNQDLKGVLATMTDKATLMGTGPGEIWSGLEEIKVAYEHFFQGYDKGQQKFDYQFKIGNLGADMGWLMASGEIRSKKDSKAIDFPLNVSLTVVKSGKQWKIAAMHFSTLTGPESASK
jgi:uncharacterized protein (TIGR02246 family)